MPICRINDPPLFLCGGTARCGPCAFTLACYFGSNQRKASGNQKSPKRGCASGTIKQSLPRYHPCCRLSVGLLVGLIQVLRRDNGAIRSALLHFSGVQLGSETALSPRHWLAPSANSLHPPQERLNSVKAIKNILSGLRLLSRPGSGKTNVFFLSLKNDRFLFRTQMACFIILQRIDHYFHQSDYSSVIISKRHRILKQLLHQSC